MVEKYYSRLTVDFQTNKRVCDEIAIIPTKRLRNKIAGYITVRYSLHVAHVPHSYHGA
jgi:small subunit ribosomal protein S17e